MRKNNGRRRHRGHNRRNISNINKNTVLESYGPVSHIRGNVHQLIEKYTSLASDASSNDDKVLSEACFQFADHYFRLNKEIEALSEVKNNLKSDTNNNISDDNESTGKVDLKNEDEAKPKVLIKPSRKERSFQAREDEDKEKKNGFNQDKIPKKFLKKEKIQVNNIKE